MRTKATVVATWVVGIAVTAAWVVGLYIISGSAHQAQQSTQSTPQSTQTCNEDEPCWDCKTMGNHICGPQDQSFLPAYMDILQGKQPMPQDRCYPHDLETLLIPCDQP